MRFNITVLDDNLLKKVMLCELPDEMYYKLQRRLNDREHLIGNKNFARLDNEYCEEIEVILKHIKVI